METRANRVEIEELWRQALSKYREESWKSA